MGDGVVWDRAYADYRVMATLVARQCPFGIRLPRQRGTAVTAVWAAPDQERVGPWAVPPKARAEVEPQRPPTRRVRLVTGLLASGAGEGLGTDVLEAQPSPAAEFKAVSGWRGQQESSQARSKKIFAVERFSGNSAHALTPALSGVLFVATWASLLSQPAQAVLPAPGEARAGRSAPQGNRAVRYVPGVEHSVQ